MRFRYSRTSKTRERRKRAKFDPIRNASCILGPLQLEMSAYPDFDGSLRETTRRWLRNSEEEQIYAAKSVHDENTDGAKNGLHVTSTTGETDDNESILSWEETSDEVEVPVTPTPLPVRPLGLSRRAGYTQFSDYE